jgi:hypothetical protein
MVGLTAVRQRFGPTRPEPPSSAELPEDALQWSWPPYAPIESDDAPFETAEWAPSTVVWHPQFRFGRWIVVHRR